MMRDAGPMFLRDLVRAHPGFDVAQPRDGVVFRAAFEDGGVGRPGGVEGVDVEGFVEEVEVVEEVGHCGLGLWVKSYECGVCERVVWYIA